jgi:hypothetical protein
MPDRLTLSRKAGFKLPEGARSVARPTIWGNPFVTGRDGTAAQCVSQYAVLLSGFIHVAHRVEAELQEAILWRTRARIGELKSLSLACWCRQGAPCHATVLMHCAAHGFTGLGLYVVEAPSPRILFRATDFQLDPRLENA